MKATAGEEAWAVPREAEGGQTDMHLPVTLSFNLSEIGRTLRNAGVEPASLTLGDGLSARLERYGNEHGLWLGEATIHAVEQFLDDHGTEQLDGIIDALSDEEGEGS